MQVDIYSIQHAWQAANQDRSLLQDLQARGIQSIDSQLTPPAKANLTDIYFVIMDSCARADVLANKFGYNDQPFMDFLQQKGFYVPQCARSNFPKTYLSLATSMNMNYPQSFGADLIKVGINYEDWGIYAKWGAVRQTLAGLPGNKVSSNCLTTLAA